MAKKKRNKQRMSRGSSFRQLAINLRKEARWYRSKPGDFLAEARTLEAVARCHDAEAKRLRAMR